MLAAGKWQLMRGGLTAHLSRQSFPGPQLLGRPCPSPAHPNTLLRSSLFVKLYGIQLVEHDSPQLVYSIYFLVGRTGRMYEGLVAACSSPGIASLSTSSYTRASNYVNFLFIVSQSQLSKYTFAQYAVRVGVGGGILFVTNLSSSSRGYNNHPSKWWQSDRTRWLVMSATRVHPDQVSCQKPFVS